jgi:hypothetical protein
VGVTINVFVKRPSTNRSQPLRVGPPQNRVVCLGGKRRGQCGDADYVGAAMTLRDAAKRAHPVDAVAIHGLADEVERLQRELADVIAHRDSETRWAAQYKAERDRARECLREVMAAMVGTLVSESNPIYPKRWVEAAGESK